MPPSTTSLPKTLRSIVHLCYGGTSGSTTVALNIAKGSSSPSIHHYVFYSTGSLRPDYPEFLDPLGSPWTFVSKKPGLSWGNLAQIARTLLDFEPQVIVFHGSRTLPLALYLRVCRPRLPFLAILHGPDYEITRPLPRFICTLYVAISQGKSTVSSDMFHLIQRYPLLARLSSPLQVIPNGVDADFWYSPPPRFHEKKKLNLGMIATLEAYKDHPTFLSALKLLATCGYHFHVSLLGSGSQESLLKQMVERLGLHADVHFLGNQTASEVRRLLHTFDILVHSSLSESFGMAVVEGMLASRPIIASAVPGIQGILETKHTGILVEKQNPEQLAQALEWMYAHPEAAFQMGESAQRYASKHFSLSQMSSTYETFLEKLVFRD